MTASGVDTGLEELLKSLDAGWSVLNRDDTSCLPIVDGISLLDIKNELLLSYLHNLVFFIILKLRHVGENEPDGVLRSASRTIQKLVELRVYLDKGIRPLEGQLKYQIEKIISTSDDAEQTAARIAKVPPKLRQDVDYDNSDNSGLESTNSPSKSHLGGPVGEDRSYAPRLAALARPLAQVSRDKAKTIQSKQDAPYKPPRITPTTMPAPPSARNQDRKRRSNLVDEYVETELSTAPTAQPSIGSNSTILDRGRGSLTGRQRAKEQERLEYEESNLTRLPGESKAEPRKARLRGEDAGSREMFGGEDWTGLGGLGDRVSRSVRATGPNREGLLQRREKRGRETQDGPRGDGSAMGGTFEKRRKILLDRVERKHNRVKR